MNKNVNDFNKMKVMNKTGNEVSVNKFFWNDDRSVLSLNFTILELLQNVDKFHIPFFQRIYKWSTVNIKELFDDIMSNESYFIGQTIIKKYYGTNDEYQLIDGQQRLTTILMLLSIIHKKMPKNNEFDFDKLLHTKEESGEKIFSILKYENNSGFIKYSTLSEYKNCELIINEAIKSGLKIKYICEKILSTLINVNKFPEDANENKLFEKLNSTGMDLSASDLLRNFLLMKVKDGKSKNKVDKSKEIDKFFTETLPKEIMDKKKMPYNGLEGRFYKTFIAYYSGSNVDEQKDKRMYTLIRKKFIEENDKVDSFLTTMKKFISFSKRLHKLMDVKKSMEKIFNIQNILCTVYQKNTTSIIPIFFALERNYGKKFESITNKEYIDFVWWLSFKSSILHLAQKSSKIDRSIQRINKNLNAKDLIKNIKSENPITIEDIENHTSFMMEVDNSIMGDENNKITHFKEHYKLIMINVNNLITKNSNYKIEMGSAKYTIEHIIPIQWEKNPKWNSYIGNVKDEINKRINNVQNLMILRKDLSGNGWLDQKLLNYKQKCSGLAGRYADVIEQQESDWNKVYEDGKNDKSRKDDLDTIMRIENIYVEIFESVKKKIGILNA